MALPSEQQPNQRAILTRLLGKYHPVFPDREISSDKMEILGNIKQLNTFQFFNLFFHAKVSYKQQFQSEIPRKWPQKKGTLKLVIGANCSFKFSVSLRLCILSFWCNDQSSPHFEPQTKEWMGSSGYRRCLCTVVGCSIGCHRGVEQILHSPIFPGIYHYFLAGLY